MTNADKVNQLHARCLALSLEFNITIVDSIKAAYKDGDIDVCINADDNIVVIDQNDEADPLECIVCYDVPTRRAYVKLILRTPRVMQELLDVYLSTHQVQLYHELISALQALTLFNQIESSQ